MSIVELVKNAGVVGAGGAGFPTHVKLNCKAETVIANGAECEPLLRVDQLTMQEQAALVVKGMEAAMEAVGAKRGVIATKAHYEEAVHALSTAIQGKSSITLHLMDSYYPAGDEKSVIFEVTGQVVPSGKLPLDVGCVVCNVATLANIANALEGRPVVEKSLTIGGDVPNPVTVTAPVGTSIAELLPLSGFSGNAQEYALIVGGPCMGRLEEDWSAPITKTTGGLLLFKRTHPLIVQTTMPVDRQVKLAKAVCCQCNQCTLLCPRNSLGLHVEPHKAMRAIAQGKGALLGNVNGILACSSCGLCTNFSCNMGLTPSAIMAQLKNQLSQAGVRPVPEAEIVTDPFIASKHVLVKRLIARMGLSGYDVPAPPLNKAVVPKCVKILLSQHLGKPSQPIVKVGDTVGRNDLIAVIPEKSLGAMIHASMDGTVTEVTDRAIIISR